MNTPEPLPENIPFFKPSFSEAEEAAVIRVLRSGWLTTGSETLAFEKEFAAFTGSPLALAVNSATSGLMLAMDAFGIGAGTAIVTTPYTFVSTATSATHLGGSVIYADIEKDGYNIDPERVEDALRARADIRAIVPVHVAGVVCNMADLLLLGKKYRVAVIEDAAHSFPAKTKAGYAGTLGDAGVFSFYATKTITTGEGGMICLRDSDRAKRITTMRSHGIDRTVWDRYTSSKASWIYDVVEEGWKFNMPDILAAIGRVQLLKAETLLQKRIEIARRFNEGFRDTEGLILPPDGDGNAWHLYLLRLDGTQLTVSRDDFARELQAAGLGISVHFIPHFEFSVFQKRYNLNRSDFPESADRFEATVSLPFWPDMSEEMIERVIRTVNETARRHRRASN